MSYASRVPRPLAAAELLETWEAAFYLAVKPRTLDEYIQRAFIRAVGTGRQRRILAASIRDYIAKGGMPSAPKPSNIVASAQPRLDGRFACSPPAHRKVGTHRDNSAAAPADVPGSGEEER